jgi:hypothetical protein
MHRDEDANQLFATKPCSEAVSLELMPINALQTQSILFKNFLEEACHANVDQHSPQPEHQPSDHLHYCQALSSLSHPMWMPFECSTTPYDRCIGVFLTLGRGCWIHHRQAEWPK